MGALKDYTGKIFGNLTVLYRDGLLGDHRIAWVCQCSCGKITKRSSHALNAGVISCGCIKGQKIFPQRIAKCLVCGVEFLYRCPASKEKKFCSDVCWKVHRYAYLASRRRNSVRAILDNRYQGAKTRSRKRKWMIDIDLDWLEEQYSKQNGLCAITKIPLTTEAKSPWGISIDRVDNKKGYTRDNVRIVCNIFNYAKHIWTDDTLRQFINEYVKYNK